MTRITAAKLNKKPTCPPSPLRGRVVRILTPAERTQDIKEFGKEIRKSKESATAFLKSAGILDESGELAEPFRP